MTLAAIPSPSTAVWHLLGLPIRAYALCIVAGIVVACLVTEVRLRQRGVAPWAVLDLAVWAVPFGIVGARLYHVISSPQGYFGDGGAPIKAFYIWEGGLGIWGGVAGGALGAWLAARQLGLPLRVFADAVAPGLPLAQAVGRFGNWFNNELYGKVTTLPWGLQVHDMDRENPGRAILIDGQPVVLPDLYHPTFLYEALWDVGVAVLVLIADRRYKFGKGRAFALYVMAYTVGRFWIELLRTDEANHFFGIRLNVFTSIVVFLGALAYFLLVKGPRDYLVPIDAPESAEALVAAGGVAPLDAPSGDTGTAAAPPTAYRAVSEERFEGYRRTGILPPETVADPAPAAPDTTLSAPALPTAPITKAEPVVAPESVTEVVPVVAPESVTEVVPVVAPESVTEVVPVVAPESVTEVVPVVAPESVTEVVPVVAPEPVTEVVPVVAPEPVTKAEPAVAADTVPGGDTVGGGAEKDKPVGESSSTVPERSSTPPARSADER